MVVVVVMKKRHLLYRFHNLKSFNILLESLKLNSVCTHKPKSATRIAVQLIVSKAFSSQNLNLSSFTWSED